MPTGSPCWVKPAGHGHRRGIDQERVEVRRALLVHVGRVDAVLDQRRRVLDGLVDDGVELVVRHHLHDVDHQLVARRRFREAGPGPRRRPTAAASPCRSPASCGPPPSSGTWGSGGARSRRPRRRRQPSPSPAPRRASSSLSCGTSIGSTIVAPAAFSSPTALSKRPVTVLKSVGVRLGRVAHRRPQNADACALQAVLVEELRVASRGSCRRRGR